MSTKNQISNLEQINNELKAFLDLCKENHLTEQEIMKICQPLTTSIKRANTKYYFRYGALFVLFLIAAYYLTYFDSIAWHLSAIGRIILIKLLPYWDWQHLKNEKCLLPNIILNQEISLPLFDCVLCESIDKIYVEHQIDPVFLNEHYVDLHNPVILLDALQNWPIFQNPNLTYLLDDNTIHDSIPCKLSTNIHNGPGSAGKILNKIKSFHEYFLHFQNCDFEATKAFRIISPRPTFLPAELSPVQYNWLLVSKNYNVSNFKPISLKEPITVIGQANGSNFFRLLPRRNCHIECPILNIELMRGEALIFTSMWDLEYKPNVASENIAIILEMH